MSRETKRDVVLDILARRLWQAGVPWPIAVDAAVILRDRDQQRGGGREDPRHQA